jgi:hypothetical protein
MPLGATGGLPAREFTPAHLPRMGSKGSVATRGSVGSIVLYFLPCSLQLLTVNGCGTSTILVIAMN